MRDLLEAADVGRQTEPTARARRVAPFHSVAWIARAASSGQTVTAILIEPCRDACRRKRRTALLTIRAQEWQAQSTTQAASMRDLPIDTARNESRESHCS